MGLCEKGCVCGTINPINFTNLYCTWMLFVSYIIFLAGMCVRTLNATNRDVIVAIKRAVRYSQNPSSRISTRVPTEGWRERCWELCQSFDF